MLSIGIVLRECHLDLPRYGLYRFFYGNRLRLYIDLAIHTTVTYNGAAALGGRVKLYASKDDGTNYDDDPFWSYDLPFTAGVTKSYSQRVPFAQKRIKVQVTNLDTGQPITAIYAYYTGQSA